MPWSAYYEECLDDEQVCQQYEQQMDFYFRQMQQEDEYLQQKYIEEQEDKENYPLFFLKDGIV